MELYVQNIKQLIELEVLEQKQLYMIMTVTFFVIWKVPVAMFWNII